MNKKDLENLSKRDLDILYRKALKHGATEFGISRAKNKRFYVVYNGRRINFGSKFGSTFIDHYDINKRTAWLARHSKILKQGSPAYLDITSPEYWSWNILW